MLKCASDDLEVIILRQQAITFFTSLGNVEFVEGTLWQYQADQELLLSDEPAGEQHNDGVRLAGHEPHAQCAGAAHPASLGRTSSGWSGSLTSLLGKSFCLSWAGGLGSSWGEGNCH